LIRIFLPEHDVGKNSPEDVGSKAMGIRQEVQAKTVIFMESSDHIYLFDSEERQNSPDNFFKKYF
jgi:hypothetical protein